MRIYVGRRGQRLFDASYSLDYATIEGIVLSANTDENRRVDIGLLILRGASLFLAITFGREKLLGFIVFLRSGLPLDSYGFTHFLQSLGFPAPGLLAVGAVLNESVVALFVAVGFMSRLFSGICASGMAIAFFVSIKLGEEPLRAALYFIIFSVLVITGPGTISVDHWIQRKRTRAKPRESL